MLGLIHEYKHGFKLIIMWLHCWKKESHIKVKDDEEMLVFIHSWFLLSLSGQE